MILTNEEYHRLYQVVQVEGTSDTEIFTNQEYADIMVKSEYEGTLEDISKQREQYSKVLETRKGLADCRSQYVNMIKYNEQLTNKK